MSGKLSAAARRLYFQAALRGGEIGRSRDLDVACVSFNDGGRVTGRLHDLKIVGKFDSIGDACEGAERGFDANGLRSLDGAQGRTIQCLFYPAVRSDAFDRIRDCKAGTGGIDRFESLHQDSNDVTGGKRTRGVMNEGDIRPAAFQVIEGNQAVARRFLAQSASFGPGKIEGEFIAKFGRRDEQNQ